MAVTTDRRPWRKSISAKIWSRRQLCTLRSLEAAAGVHTAVAAPLEEALLALCHHDVLTRHLGLLGGIRGTARRRRRDPRRCHVAEPGPGFKALIVEHSRVVGVRPRLPRLP